MKILIAIFLISSVVFSNTTKTEFVETIKNYRCTIGSIIDFNKNETKQLKNRDVMIGYIDNDTVFFTFLNEKGALRGSSPDLIKGEKVGESFKFEDSNKSITIIMPPDPTKEAVLLQYGKIKNTPLFFVTRHCKQYN